ncbi:hypothetical protein A3860_05365 [Niastella vici]|uniref:Erythromycin esterase n=1 Tax=Niastella vici TaxID=1703345 RepID=A0A1V9FS55_9BACT|nr:erythromycin esterase family protein [Niastella vici]OQP61148.1 hypothetical protein A3860_05365 [Niastella vici]
MKPFLFLLSAILAFSVSNAQLSLKEHIQGTAMAIRTVHPDSTDFSDLEVIGNSIGDARIVMLGEQDHGDAPTYLAKTRLVKYLHEKKGFTVLAIESDFFALNRGWDLLPKDSASVVKYLLNNIFTVWTGCDACFPLFRQYLPGTFQTASPIQIAGFDNQMMLPYSNQLAHQLDSVLLSLQLPVTKTPEYRQQIIPTIDLMRMWWRSKPDLALYDQCAAWLQQIRKEAAQQLSANDFWLQVIDNLLQENEHYRFLKDKDKYSKHSNNVRDLQMAANLAWLCKVKYPNEKIIVWAASQHISKTREDMPDNPRKVISMGGAFTADPSLAANTYVVGFSSYEGTAGRIGFPDYTLPKPKKESFENWVRPKGAYSFVDFKKYQQAHAADPGKFYMSGYNHYNVEAQWTRLYDGIFYIDQMYTCKKQP